MSQDGPNAKGKEPWVPAKSSIVVLSLGESVEVYSIDGNCLTDKYAELLEEDEQALQYVQTLYSNAAVPGCVSFVTQDGSVYTVDFQKNESGVDCTLNIPGEMESVCADPDGNIWVCGAAYGQSYGVVMDPASGTSIGGFVDEGGEANNDGGEDVGAVGVCSMFPFSDEMMVSKHHSHLHVYDLGCKETRTLDLPGESWALCTVPRPHHEPFLIAVVVDAPPLVQPEEPLPAALVKGAKRHRKVLSQAPTRNIAVISSIDGSVVQTFTGTDDCIPVRMYPVPDGSVLVSYSEGQLKRMVPTADPLQPLLPPHPWPGKSVTIRGCCGVAATSLVE